MLGAVFDFRGVRVVRSGVVRAEMAVRDRVVMVVALVYVLRRQRGGEGQERNDEQQGDGSRRQKHGDGWRVSYFLAGGATLTL